MCMLTEWEAKVQGHNGEVHQLRPQSTHEAIHSLFSVPALLLLYCCIGRHYPHTPCVQKCMELMTLVCFYKAYLCRHPDCPQRLAVLP